MRNLILISIIGIFTLVGCVQTKPVKTIENLKTAIIFETNASVMYAAFSGKAQQNYPAIAKLFEAVSKSDSIHAANYKKLLEKMGGKMDEIVPEFVVEPTLVNLQVTIKEETNSIDVMYPLIIADAIAEKSDKSVQAFTWAYETEKENMKLFLKAISAVFDRIENNNTSGVSLPTGYSICPVCGKIYDNAIALEKCDLCPTGKDKFLNI